MQGGQFQFKLDKENLIKAGTIPVIAAAVAGLAWLLGLFNPLAWLLGIAGAIVSAFAGYWYVSLVLKSGAKPTIVDVAINGAILGAVVALVYAIASGIGLSIATSGMYSILGGSPSNSLFGDVLQGAIGGAIGAGGWFAYKTGMIKTS